MAMLGLYAHGTDYSISVAMVRSADVGSLVGGGSTNEGERKGSDCHSLGMQVGCSNGTNVHSLPTSRSKMNRLMNLALSMGETLTLWSAAWLVMPPTVLYSSDVSRLRRAFLSD